MFNILNKYHFLLFLIITKESFVSICSENEEKKEDLYAIMIRPIEFSKSGINSFLINIYNHDEYKNLLSSCLIHILDLFESANKTNSPSIFIQQVLNIFIQKIYETTIINPHSFLYFLQQSNHYINEIIKSEKMSSEMLISENIKHLLMDEKSLSAIDIKDFSEKSSKKIFNAIENDYFLYIETQNLYFEFLEICIGKIFFYFDEISESLECFNQITQALEYIYSIKILRNEEMLNKLLWLLCIQFCKSIELQKNMNFIKNDHFKINISEFLNNLSPKLFSHEIETVINTKKNYLSKNINTYLLK